ncbi:alpha/beta hydrolase fold domain-containing protein [Bacillus sp. B15-48]|uniref:alpha/beta hydrolase fold domain-containing protein n=1 Tax=Bacillus sp. B15-48 TaxID=1548601 RepID=UPI0031B821DD|nr:alpha/beta hydrolase fold domain-containing protein [Bacillus sp. B15-48]
MIANKTGRIIVSVDYRLAPEYTFPTPVQDAYDALVWVSENAAHFNGTASNFGVGGYGPYNQICIDIAGKGYEGFSLMSNSNC